MVGLDTRRHKQEEGYETGRWILVDYGDVLAHGIPGARAVRLPAAHLSSLERPRSFTAALLGFLLFRVLDIVKPWPARQMENLHGGVGVMAEAPVTVLLRENSETFELTPEEEDEILESVVAIERGEPTSPAKLLERYPEQADYLKLYLSGLQMFHAAARVWPGLSAVVQRRLADQSRRLAELLGRLVPAGRLRH
mgnify:CR=1 FL=1